MANIKLSKAAKILGISVPTMRRWKESHKDILKPAQIGAQWFVDAEAVQDIKSGKIKITFDKKKVKKKD